MRPLITLSARLSAVAIAVAFAVGMTGGMVRLLPWLVSPDVPAQLAVPFARLLGVAAFEAAVLVGLPIGVCLGAAMFVERGEARALAALGARPARLVAVLAGPGVLLIALVAALSSVVDPAPPGRFAGGLLAAGRRACGDSARPRRIDVPLVSVAWLCFRDGPRIVGRVPGTRAAAWFSAESIRPSDDLRAVALDDLRLGGRLATTELRLHVSRVRLIGLPGWGPSRLLSGARRGFVVAVSAVTAAFAAAWLVVRRPPFLPVAAAALTGTAAVIMLAAVKALDARAVPAALYGVVPALGVAAQVAAFGVAEAFIRGRVAGRRAE